MQSILSQRAAPGLRGVVAGFQERRGHFGGGGVTLPLPARTQQFIEIYLADRYGVSIDGAAVALAPAAVLSGPQTYRRNTLHLNGDIAAFTIHFRPTGLHRLFGLSMPDLVNEAPLLTDVIGNPGQRLQDAVLAAPDFAGRVAAVERWLSVAIDSARAPLAIDHAAALLLRSRGMVRIEALAAHTGLSPRHFAPSFSARVGIAPKFYARIARFNAVMSAHAARPESRWTELVQAVGYFDQAHFVNEAQALAGAPPRAFVRETAGSWLRLASDYSN